MTEKTLNASQLANLMLAWEEMQREANELEDQIKVAVFALGKTQTVGNVRAAYRKGRKSYDYQQAVEEDPSVGDEVLDSFTTTVTKVDWRGICTHAGIKDIPFTQSDPTVSVKLV